MLDKVSMAKVKKPRKISVRDFYEEYKDKLQMKLLSSECGFDRVIREPTVNRPGLAFSGFYKYFANKRIQILGAAEQSFLKSLSDEKREECYRVFCGKRIPCIVLARGAKADSKLMEIAENYGISVFSSKMITMKFINLATFSLESSFSPTVVEHGCMVDVKGIGILIRGKSGVGKSESVLGLIERGASLVADDLVFIRLTGANNLVASSKELGRFYMEVRGLGIINVASLFGIGHLRLRQKLNLVVTLLQGEDFFKLERLGLKETYYKILNTKVRHVGLPVAPGRDMAKIIEVAALDQKLKSLGYNSALEFDKNLASIISKKNNDLTIS